MGVNLKRIVWWLALALAVLYVVQFPQSAAEVVRDTGHGVAVAGSALVSFVGSLV